VIAIAASATTPPTQSVPRVSPTRYALHPPTPKAGAPPMRRARDRRLRNTLAYMRASREPGGKSRVWRCTYPGFWRECCDDVRCRPSPLKGIAEEAVVSSAVLLCPRQGVSPSVTGPNRTSSSTELAWPANLGEPPALNLNGTDAYGVMTCALGMPSISRLQRV
jgi:hypothetical protein